ncbi:MAG: enoyl-CoA hydratase/isomerase family protein [Alphaproteobacteria bacterium]|nr:enoyl-CoA hydratase/isomerase family protein [Alphaproteobacteria bacterium]
MSTAPTLTCTKLEIAGRVATFTLNRPEALNALSWQMREDFKALVDFVEGNEAIGALVLAGEGRAFCAGGDVTTMTDRVGDGPGPSRQRILDVHQWLLRLHNIDCPVIAAVEGLAFGGGFSLALTADLVFASEKARFCAVFARIGLMPDMGLAYTLPRLVGPQMAKDLMFTGRSITAVEAQALGLVHSLHPAGETLAAAQAYAARLAEGPKTAQSLTKRLVNKSFERGWQDVADAEADGQTLLFSSAFAQEAIRRFLAKEPGPYNWDAPKG